MRPITTIELFAGIAGFSSPHTQPLAFVENDANCRAILRRHYPHALILEDVTTAGAHNLPRANVVKMGFPCQDLSVAGNRAGLTGARSGLFYEGTRIADELRPDYLIWENVPGLLSSRAGRDFLSVLTELDRIGLAGGWTTVDAQFFGVAQRRCRVFGVFARRDIGAARCAEILSLAARLPWNLTPGYAKRANVAATIRAGSAGNGVNKPGRRGDDDVNVFAMAPAIALSNRGRETGAVFETIRAGSHGALPMVCGSERVGNNALTAHHGRNSGEDEFIVAGTLGAAHGRNRGLGQENEVDMLVCGALSAAHGGADDNDAQAGHIVAVSVSENQRGELRTSNIAAQLTSGGGKPGQGYSAVLAFTERTRAEGRTLEAQEDLAYALTNPGSGGRTHSRQIAGTFGVRRLTPTECERLQGFPDDYTAWGIDEQGRRVEMSDSTRYRMLGNAICRKVSAWIDSQIVRHS